MHLIACRDIGNIKCPPPLWPSEEVISEFKNYPEYSHMQNFFIDYIWQQEKLELCK